MIPKSYYVTSKKCAENASDACMRIVYKANLATNYVCAQNVSCDSNAYGTYGFSHVFCCFYNNCNMENLAISIKNNYYLFYFLNFIILTFLKI